MALKVELKSNERIIIGTALVRNGDQRTSLIIEGDAPILREKDILNPKDANSPAKLIYLIIQMMYVDGTFEQNIGKYEEFITDFREAVPSSSNIIDNINNYILKREFYKALKEAKQLLIYEKMLLDNAARNTSLCEDTVQNA